jgi:hypothetical protein
MSLPPHRWNSPLPDRRRAQWRCRTSMGCHAEMTAGRDRVTHSSPSARCSLQRARGPVRCRPGAPSLRRSADARTRVPPPAVDRYFHTCARAPGSNFTGKFPVNCGGHRHLAVNSADIAIRVLVMCRYHRNRVRSREGMQVPPRGFVLSHAQDSGYIAPRARVAKGTSCLQ